jgi:hypothetical protein
MLIISLKDKGKIRKFATSDLILKNKEKMVTWKLQNTWGKLTK